MGNAVTIYVLKMDENRTVTQFSTTCLDIESLVEVRDTLDENNVVRKIQVECRDYTILIVIKKEGLHDV